MPALPVCVWGHLFGFGFGCQILAHPTAATPMISNHVWLGKVCSPALQKQSLLAFLEG